jgi:Ca2+-binding RTX toxin-like protein
MALIKGTNGGEVIRGTTASDEIYGFGGNDRIYGYEGHDLVSGGAGNDTLYGGSGDDDIYGDSGINTLYGGSGADWFRSSDRSTGLSDDFIADFELGQDRIDLREWGVSDFNQVQALLGNTSDGGAILNAYLGGINHVIEIADVARGEFVSADFVFDGSTRDRDIAGTNSADVLFGGRGHDLIDGNGGSDKLLGGLGDDDIYGESGNDQIWGGLGSDLMSGGSGDDVFRFVSVSEMTSASGRDVIADFQINDGAGYDDLIDLSKLDADLTRAGNQAFDFIGRDSFVANSPGELRYTYNSAGDTVIVGNIDNDTSAEFQIVLIGRHVLDVSDFIV